MDGAIAGEPADWIIPPLSAPVEVTHSQGAIRNYLRVLSEDVDYLEFGDPVEYLATIGVSAVHRSRLGELWVMPMVRQLLVGRTRSEQQARSEVEFPLSRVLLDESETVQVFVGGPGSGKSTVSRYVAALLAGHILEGLEGAHLPVLIPVRSLRWGQSDSPEELLIKSAVSSIQRATPVEREEMADVIREHLDSACLIVDGLDEAPATERAEGSDVVSRSEVYHAILDFAVRHPRARILVTSRDHEYLSSPYVLTNAYHYTMSNFSRAQIESSIVTWHRAAEEAARAAGRELDKWQQRRDELLDLVRFDSDLGQLAEVPLLLNLMQVVFRPEDDFPRNISQLASRAVRLLIIDNPRFRNATGGQTSNRMDSTAEAVLLDGLRRLAYAVTARAGTGGAMWFTPGEIYEAVDTAAEEVRGNDGSAIMRSEVGPLVRHIERGHGIIVRAAPRRFEFSHNVFRDVLAGQDLDRLDRDSLKALAADPAWLLPLRYWAGWKSTMPDFGGHVCLVATELLEHGTSLVSRDRTVVLLAVGEIVTELTRPGSAIREWAMVRSIRDRVVTLLSEALAAPDLGISLRVRAGDILGSLGDPRITGLVGGGSRLLASLVPLEANSAVTFGRSTPHKTTRQKYTRVPASPRFTGPVNAFSIGLYPVTNAEFRAFVEDDGYQSLEFWQYAEGRRWAAKEPGHVEFLLGKVLSDIEVHYGTELAAGRVTPEDLRDIADVLVRRSRPLYWDHPRFNRSNQPVVGVNFWEASAYCCWLTARLRADELIGQDVEVRLPTEFEWEYAARRGTDLSYPWGKDLDSDGRPNAHVRDHDGAKIGRTCAVGSFPWARWDNGPFDIVGNVWEWTNSAPSSYPCALTPPSSGMTERVTRGSSWLSQEPESPQVTFRSYDPPVNAYEDLGFRIVLASARRSEPTVAARKWPFLTRLRSRGGRAGQDDVGPT